MHEINNIIFTHRIQQNQKSVYIFFLSEIKKKKWKNRYDFYSNENCQLSIVIVQYFSGCLGLSDC
jgi:hypothetical protein